jgi:hypothetical protein
MVKLKVLKLTHTPAHWAPHTICGHVVDEGHCMELVPARENTNADIRPALHKRTFLWPIADGWDEGFVKLLHGNGAACILISTKRCHQAELHGDVEREQIRTASANAWLLVRGPITVLGLISPAAAADAPPGHPDAVKRPCKGTLLVAVVRHKDVAHDGCGSWIGLLLFPVWNACFRRFWFSSGFRI